MAEYVELLKIVEQIEGSSTRQELGHIDVTSIISAQPHQEAARYADLMTMISRIEAAQRPQREELIRERQRIETAERQAAVEQQAAAAAQQPRETPAYERYGEQMAQEVGNVRGELGSLAARLGTIKPKLGELKAKRINTKDLVLPSLPLSDQITELERIIEGLKQGVFDDDHLSIVRQEVFGLDQVVREEEKIARGALRDQTEQSLVVVRAQRIADAEALLSGRVGG